MIHNQAYLGKIYGSRPFCISLDKSHLFSLIQHRFILIQLLPLYVCCMFRPVLRPSSGMSTQKAYKGRYFGESSILHLSHSDKKISEVPLRYLSYLFDPVA